MTIGGVPQRTLGERDLNRALLARQLLLERVDLPIVDAVEQIGGLQTQYAPSGYVGLWTRLRGFERDALTRALEDRSVIQATTLRTTIHMVSRREYWPQIDAIREPRRAWAIKVQPRGMDETAMVARAGRLREALRHGPRSVRELDGIVDGFVGLAGLWIDLVRVPPSGTWERRRADRLALAEDWVGPDGSTEADGRATLVRAYLRAFGPAPLRDAASWAGLQVGHLKPVLDRLDLVRHTDAAGRELLDLPGAPLPDGAAPAPVRFLPHWDAALLVHARRTGILPEEHRPKVFTTKNPFSVGTVVVDGRVVAGWSVRDGRVEVELYEEVSRRDRDAIEDERAALEAFHA